MSSNNDNWLFDCILLKQFPYLINSRSNIASDAARFMEQKFEEVPTKNPFPSINLALEQVKRYEKPWLYEDFIPKILANY